jgi:hypothetical protein
MSSALTNKTMVVVSRLGDFWVTPDQGKNVMQVKKSDPSGSLELDGNLIGCSTIDGVLHAEQYDSLNMKRRGGWQCKYQNWHERGQQCAHAQLYSRQ